MNIKAAVIGTGIGIKHIEAIDGYKSSKVIIIYEKNKKKVSSLKKKFPHIKITSSEKDIFNDKNINFVSIASYDNFHFSQIIKCINKNFNIMVEKPLCLSLKELISVKKALKRSKTKISSNMVLRANKMFINIKHKIKNEKIFYVESDYMWGRIEKLFGWRSKVKNFSFTLGAAIHMIDLVCWLLNKRPLSVITIGNKIVTKNTIFKKKSFLIYLLKFSQNLIVKVTANMVGTHEHFHNLKIYSKNKTLFHTRDGSYILKKNKKLFTNNLSYAYPDKKNRKKVIRNFIDSIKNSNVKKIISQKEIFDLMSICFAADESLKLNREVKINYKI